jgi:hypothetical protein
MNEQFVEECRREWKRLGVSDALAEEMAADLASDLRDAEADGVSAEELLGASASNPRAFAAEWAAGRGILPTPPAPKRRRLPAALVAFTALAVLALLFAAVALATGQPKVSLVASQTKRPPGAVGPVITRHAVRATASAAAPIEWILLVGAVVALCFAAWLWSNWARTRALAAAA